MGGEFSAKEGLAAQVKNDPKHCMRSIRSFTRRKCHQKSKLEAFKERKESAREIFTPEQQIPLNQNCSPRRKQQKKRFHK